MKMVLFKIISEVALYENISNIYNEPFNDPEESEIPIPYSYWEGYFV